MLEFPRKLYRFFPNLLHILLIPTFFLVSVLVYEPGPLMRLLECGKGDVNIVNIVSFNMAIISAILLVVMTICRVLFYFFSKKMGLNIPWYLAWCLLEIILMSAFVSLYLALMTMVSGDYFIILGRSLSVLASLMVFPYLIFLLVYAYQDAVMRKQMPDEGVRLRFYDNRHLLKFVTNSDSILYLESEENYVNIHYLDNGTKKKYQLRNSLKNVESLCEKAGFVRSHRRYIINPAHIKVLRKDKDGIMYAELDADDVRTIPVSKTYYKMLSDML